MKTGQKWWFSFAIVTIVIVSGCARPSHQYALISPYETISVTKGLGGDLVGFISPDKGIVQVIDLEGWILKISGTKETPSGPLIEDRGQLSGLVASGSLWIALNGKQIYALKFLHSYQSKLPPEDIKDDGSFIIRDGGYLVKGYKGKTLSSPKGDIPLLFVIYFERIKP